MLSLSFNRCRIPSYPGDTYEIQNVNHSRLINATIPMTTDDNGDLVYDRCSYYVINMSVTNTTRGEKRRCKSWVYDKSEYLSTFTDQVWLQLSANEKNMFNTI